jgi:hypothetical protein
MTVVLGCSGSPTGGALASTGPPSPGLSSSPTPDLQTSATPSVTDSFPSSTPRAEISLGAEGTREVAIPGSREPVLLGIQEPLGLLLDARAATPAELTMAEGFGGPDVRTANVQGHPSEMILVWSGSPCDRTATLRIESKRHLTLELGLRPTCDAMAIGRGVVLVFREPIDASTITVDFHPSEVESGG